jgi:hypothetical protein
MIECIFTIDYEIYGNGKGSLRELVYEPASRLKSLFDKWGAKFVVFVEAAELQAIDTQRADSAITEVRNQIRALHNEGFEIALHLHPQWCNARFGQGQWTLDYSEYNLCTLSSERISHIVDDALQYLRTVLENATFTPISFRAGNWLMQPSARAATILAERGIQIDSSVFKGGLQRQHRMDYRRAVRNGYYWTFTDDVSSPDPSGVMTEIPIYARMVPFWKMATAKRLGLQQKGSFRAQTTRQNLNRLCDRARLFHPMKLDFCRMSLDELTQMMDLLIREDRVTPFLYKPVVAIGHTKDLCDVEVVRSFLAFLRRETIRVCTFGDMNVRCGG